MSKTTTNLYYIIQAELKNNGYNEFLSKNKNQLTFFDPERRIMSTILKYENDEIVSACRNTIFYGLSILMQNRIRFEKEFINHFLLRNVKYQTYEVSRLYLTAFCLENLEMINAIYEAEKFILLQNENLNTSTSNGQNVSKSASLYTDLPQDNTGIDLNTESMDFATNKNLSKSSNNGQSNSTSNGLSKTYNIDTLTKVYLFKAQLFNDLDKLLFSQIF